MTVDGSAFELAEPAYLWLLAGPAMLCLLWSWRLLRRALDVRGHTRAQVVPRPHRFSAIGDLGFWFCIILASALCIVALGRPRVRIASERHTAFPNKLRAADSSIWAPTYSNVAQGRPPKPPTCELHERVGLKSPPHFSIDQSPF